MGRLARARRHTWTLYAPTTRRCRRCFATSCGSCPDTAAPCGSSGRWRGHWRASGPTCCSPPATRRRSRLPARWSSPSMTSRSRPTQWFTPREGRRRRVVTAWSARRARLILTISDFSKREIATRLAQPEGRIRVIPLGARLPGDVRTTPRLPVILYVGSIFARRHVDALIDAFATVVAPALPEARLEIVGENRLPPRPPRRRARARRRRPSGPACAAFLCRRRDAGRRSTARPPSSRSCRMRGLRPDPLEAMAHGVAPVVLDTEVARAKCARSAARHVTRRPAPRRRSGDRCWSCCGRRPRGRRLRDEAPGVLSRYDWTRTAAATLAALEDAALAR